MFLLSAILVSGLAAGALHAVSGPDHMAALGPLALRRGVGSGFRLGLQWGLGHGLGILVLGLAALLLRGLIPEGSLSGWGERIVGASLVLVGLWGLRRAFSTRLHSHEHRHGGVSHSHDHAHPDSLSGHRHSHAALGLGTLHGFAGGSHFFLILPALALPGLVGALVYAGGFGAGAALAMGAFAALTARAGKSLGARMPWLLGGLSTATVALGAFWLLS